MTIDTPHSQALVGFVGANRVSLSNLAAQVSNEFCAITLSAIDAEPVARAGKLLLTAGARVENTGQEWNPDRTEVTVFGGPPSLVEPVSGTIRLRALREALSVSVQPLDGRGRALGPPKEARKFDDDWVVDVGDPATTWYEITVARAS